MSSISAHLDLDPASSAATDLGASSIRHADSGCSIVADATLYYRGDLRSSLGAESSTGSDAELILAAYLRWGEDCLDRLEGDFAFAIWDPRSRVLFCARDPYAMRPLYYHHAPGEVFVFASDARAVLQDPRVPFEIDEGRIADFLVGELEWIDYTSTFFRGILRLPPAHKVTVTATGMRTAEYRTAEPGPGTGFETDAEYREAFLEVFSRAVDERLKAPGGEAGVALSGGVDSGSIAALAGDRSRPYSLARRRGSDCEESRRVYATLDYVGLPGTQVIADDAASLHDGLAADLGEPFDGQYLFLKAIYANARHDDIRVVLDGAAGDVVLNESGYIARLMRRGDLVGAWRQVAAERAVRGGPPAALAFGGRLASAVAPGFLKQLLRAPRQRRRERGFVEESLLSPEFARHVDIGARFERMREIFSGTRSQNPAVERVLKIRPNLTAGRERYARIAASAGVEARDPYTDQRVVDFCSRLPDHQLARDGWHKFLLRDSMAGRLPDEVRWGRGRYHIGSVYNETFLGRERSRGRLTLERLLGALHAYVDAAALGKAWRAFEAGRGSGALHTAYVLSLWLERAANRPIVKDQGFS